MLPLELVQRLLDVVARRGRVGRSARGHGGGEGRTGAQGEHRAAAGAYC